MAPAISNSEFAARVSYILGWKLHEYEEVDSTNYVARDLPAWHAVRADTQTSGRGRFQRSWVSDAGGLWLSAVVPVSGPKENLAVLPLVAGLAAIDALKSMGLARLRLRWPNDIMAGEKKLAGLLLDTFDPNLAVVGLGINVTNQPAACDASLRKTATRVADLVQPPPGMMDLTTAVLDSLRTKVRLLAAGGFSRLHASINGLWGGTPRVTVELDKGLRQGTFMGVDGRGRLLLREANGQTSALDAHEVKLLREI